MIHQIVTVLKSSGPTGLLRAVGRRLHAPRSQAFSKYKVLLTDRIGLEIGGPSPLFMPAGGFPVYQLARRVDNCNFRRDTLWSVNTAGRSFVYDRKRPPGEQFICEATDLQPLRDETYDFVLSSHALEHSTNPVRALLEWRRVLKKGGLLVVVVPHKAETFDHRRPVTALAHLLQDHDDQVGEGDLTHLPEILALHDLKRDPEAGTLASFKARSERNLENRGLHHHVFDADLVVALLGHLDMHVRSIECLSNLHIIGLAEKASG